MESGNDHRQFTPIDLHTALGLVYEGIENVNSFRSPDNTVSPHPNMILIGERGRLDSLEMITLVLAVERRILEMTGRRVSLVDGEDIEPQLSAFHSPSTLADLIVAKCRD